MNQSEKLNLKNLIRDYKHESTTDKIRTLKHSEKIRNDVINIIKLKKKYSRLDPKTLQSMIEKQCDFLYTNYTNISGSKFYTYQRCHRSRSVPNFVCEP